MVGWKYKLENHGKLLREYISKEQIMENIIVIYNQMIVCLERWKSVLKK